MDGSGLVWVGVRFVRSCLTLVAFAFVALFACSNESLTTTSVATSSSDWVSTSRGFESRRGNTALRVDARGRIELTAADAPDRSSPLGFVTASITRGSWSEGLAVRPSRRERTLELPRSASRETLELREDGMEQSWTFDQLPPGEGALVVKVAVAQGVLRRTDERGMVFEANGLWTRYGRATWVDASGHRRELTSRLKDGQIELSVPADMLETTEFPATLDPVISPEQDTTGSAAPSSRPSYGMEAAYCNGLYLAAWYDEQNRIFATRVTENGTVLDPGGIELTPTSPDASYRLRVACSGNVFGVLWYRYDDSLDQPNAVEMVRVSAHGSLLDAPPIPLPLSSHYALTATDSSFVYFAMSDGKMRATRISSSGPVLDDVPIEIASATVNGEVLAARTNDASYVFWASAGSHYMARLEADGSVSTPPSGKLLFSKSGASLAAVAFDGASFLAAYTQIGKESGLPGVAFLGAYAYRFDASGTVLNPAVTVYEGPGEQYVWTAATIPGAFLVAYKDGDASFSRTVSSDALSVGPAIDLKRVGSVGLTRGTTGALAWYYGGQGQIVSENGALGAPFNVATSRQEQFAPAAVALPGQYLIGSAQSNVGPVGFNRLTASGAVLDATPIVLPAEQFLSYYPHVATDGSEYLVQYYESIGVTNSESNVRLQRVSSQGALVGSPKVVATGATYSGHDLAFDGQGYVLVWKTASESIRRSRYFANTDTWEPSLELTTRGDEADVGANATTELAVWTENQRLRGRFAYRNATPAKTQFLTSSSDVSDPEVTSDGASFLVTWRRYSPPAVLAQRWAANGSAIDAAPVVLDSSFARYEAPAATYDGARYLVAWAGVTGRDYAVKVSEISSQGVQPSVTLRSDTWPGADSAYVYPSVTIASAGGQRSLAAYSVERVNPPYGSVSVRARFLDYNNATACSSAAQCASGFCVDGVCCDTACGNSNPSDCQACSVVAGAAKNGTCGPAMHSTVCRPSAGICDLEEVCDGASRACPPDARAPTTAVCRPSQGGCDAPELCGGGPACPVDGYQPNTALCRATRGTCDEPEYCTGSSKACPENGWRESGVVCRAALDGCDLPEVCSGTSADCPSDHFASAGTLCRDAVGSCDVSEKCNGMGASCPLDLHAPIGVVCRAAAGSCDVEERCNGGAECPEDVAPDPSSCGEGGAAGSPGTSGEGGAHPNAGDGGGSAEGGVSGAAGATADAGSGGSTLAGGEGGESSLPALPSSGEGGAAGAPITTGEPPLSDEAGRSSGCGCRVPTSPNGPSSLWTVLSLLVALERRRRPRRSAAQRGHASTTKSRHLAGT